MNFKFTYLHLCWLHSGLSASALKGGLFLMEEIWFVTGVGWVLKGLLMEG